MLGLCLTQQFASSCAAPTVCILIYSDSDDMLFLKAAVFQFGINDVCLFVFCVMILFYFGIRKYFTQLLKIQLLDSRSVNNTGKL